MDIREIRKANIALIIKNEFGGNKKSFANEIKKDPSYVSRWFSEGKQKRNIDFETARDIESKLNIDSGWLDTLQDKIIGLSRTDFLKNQLLDIYEKLPLESKVLIVQYANDILNEQFDTAGSPANPFGRAKVKEKEEQ